MDGDLPYYKLVNGQKAEFNSNDEEFLNTYSEL